MTAQSNIGRYRSSVRSVAIAVLVVGFVAAFGSAAVLADPQTATPVPPSPAAQAPAAQAGATPTMTASDVLAIVASDYDTGAGGGQLSKLIHAVLKLRAQGFYPSNANKLAIQKALEYRPNQGPLIEALQETLAYQQRIKAQSQIMQQGQNANSAVMGAGQMPADSRPIQGPPPSSSAPPPPLLP